MNSNGKIIQLADLANLSERLKREGKRIVTTNGVFDLLHVAHVRMLEQSKALGDVLIVGVNSDASVKRYKSPKRPVISEGERAEMLATLACVDYVAVFDEERPLRFLELVKPDMHTKGTGSGYDIEELHETKLVRELGGELIEVESLESVSTTGIIERIVEMYGSVPTDATREE